MVTIYTDGSWRGSLKTGGYAAFVTCDNGQCALVGDGCRDTTISRMELTAMVAGLRILSDGCQVNIISDSQYACHVVNSWLRVWGRNGFVKQNGEEVANRDILEELLFHIRRMSYVKAIWVKSHTGYNDIQSLGNDLCDYTAVQCAIDAAR